MKFRIGKSEFSGLDSKTAMYAALGASLAGARVLLTTDDAGFVPAASRVTGGVAVAKPEPAEHFASLYAAFETSEREDRVVTLERETAMAGSAEQGELPKYRKQPERFALPCERETMCAGCPYRGVFYAASKLWLRTIGDGGCTLLGQKKPFQTLDAAWGRGTAAAALAGFVAARPEARHDTIAVMGAGDLDEASLRLLAKTGGTVAAVGDNDVSKLCTDCGAALTELDAYDVNGIEAVLRKALDSEGVSVIMCRGTCGKSGEKRYRIDQNRCRRCGACSRLGCPAISGRSPEIDPAECVGCGMCLAVCKCSAVVEA